MRTNSSLHRIGLTAIVMISLCAMLVLFTTAWGRAQGATISASYEAGHLDVSINGYGTTGMGTFRLDDASSGHVALCVEAHERHSTEADAYSPVDNRFNSVELDTLIWLVSRMPSVDSDTGVAAAALAWYYSGAMRNIGVPVWADGHRDFAAISPVEPERWDALGPYNLSHLIGLRAEGVDLDTAERRVVELFDAVARMAGPWHLTDSDGKFQLTGATGPIVGHPVRIEVRDHVGSPTSTVDLVTDSNGWVTPAVAAMPFGGSILASTVSPGTHREWDGPGEVQRLVTATDLPLLVERHVPAQPGHLVVVKQSTDSTIGVSGAVFELLDASHATVEQITTGPDGAAHFAPVDPSIHLGPYTIHEVSAPSGLLLSAPDQTVPSLSANQSEPTTVIMTDAPRTIPVQVEKQLSIEGVGPTDRSGFEFDLVRVADGLTTRLVTNPAGRSQPVEVALGDYTICETKVPDWATSLVDGGCVNMTITLETIDLYDETIGPNPAERPAFAVPYLNTVAPPSIVTRAHDPSDGDRLLPASGGSAIDVVTLTGLIPGTAYVITGELVPPGGLPSAVGPDEGAPTTGADTARVTSRNDFTAVESSEEHLVEFDVPALTAGKYVIVERLWVGDQLVAEHADLTDELQTIEIPTPTTTVTTSIPNTVPETPAPAATIPESTVPTETLPVAAADTSATTTTTTTTTTATTPTAPRPPVSAPTTTVARPVAPRLPSTGGGGSGQLLHLADVALIAGIGLLVITRLIPRRTLND